MEANSKGGDIEVVILDAGEFYLVHPEKVAVPSGGTVKFRNGSGANAELVLEDAGPFADHGKGRHPLADGHRSASLRVGTKAGVYKYQVYMSHDKDHPDKLPQHAKAGSRPSIIILPTLPS
jgi:hypothetical protein